MTVALEVTRLPGADPRLPLPSYQTSGAAGMDLMANLPQNSRAEGIVLAPGERIRVSTGLAVAVPEGFELQIRPRSGAALLHGLTCLNSPGTIDSDYRGEIGVILANLGQKPVLIEHGMRVAQAVLAPVARAAWREVDALGETKRGLAGFGSTGAA